jgi:hypothetical protein
MSAAIEVISTRNGAWRRIVLGGGRGNLLSLELIRELGRACTRSSRNAASSG